MTADTSITDIAHAIQLAVAPVFLLTGIGAVLAVLTNRLGRVIDRGRTLNALLLTEVEPDEADIERQLSVLSRRARLINWAISLCTACALLICAVIAVMFLGSFLPVDMSVPIALLFVTAMTALFAGLVLFLREVYLATANLRIGAR